METKKGFFLLKTAKAKQILRDLPLDASRGGFVMKPTIQKKRRVGGGIPVPASVIKRGVSPF